MSHNPYRLDLALKWIGFAAIIFGGVFTLVGLKLAEPMGWEARYLLSVGRLAIIIGAIEMVGGVILEER